MLRKHKEHTNTILRNTNEIRMKPNMKHTEHTNEILRDTKKYLGNTNEILRKC